jgi:hypothetical protein
LVVFLIVSHHLCHFCDVLRASLSTARVPAKEKGMTHEVKLDTVHVVFRQDHGHRILNNTANIDFLEQHRGTLARNGAGWTAKSAWIEEILWVLSLKDRVEEVVVVLARITIMDIIHSNAPKHLSRTTLVPYVGDGLRKSVNP